jgi:hypothetical protein
MDWTLVIAAAGLGLGIINSVVVVLTYRNTHAARVEVVVGSSIPTTDWQPRSSITATNTGHLPVTITGMAFEMTNGETLALMDGPPGNDLPAVLGLGESRQRWATRTAVVEAIHEHGKGARLKRGIAHGPGRQKWYSKRVNASWRKLGYE